MLWNDESRMVGQWFGCVCDECIEVLLYTLRNKCLCKLQTK